MTHKRKHPFIAFLLSFFPGGGHFYYGNMFTGIFYFFMTVVSAMIALFFFIFAYVPVLILILGIASLFFYMTSFVHILIVPAPIVKQQENSDEAVEKSNGKSERFFTIILSFIPGVGHFQLGLMNRGFIFLTSFIGTGIMIFLIAIFIRQDVFLIFMAFLPVVWVYSFFDAVQHLNKKQRGEKLEDRSILDDIEEKHKDGRKNKSLASILAIFPGAGHLYLGYQKRGVQLMAAFLLSLYILDVLRLGIFMFLIPIIWFYSFFDGIQKASQYSPDIPIEDKPFITYVYNQRRWIGVACIVLGAFFLLDRVFVPTIGRTVSTFIGYDIGWLYDEYFQVIVVSVLLIGGGIKFLTGSKKKAKLALEKNDM
ncbi:hypothetical protein [Evansella cellulosilytica]|uniref:TM2 domain-containing protein n=1 Tax=Evansella cellulosilytica (strain ATCC 21833 / DSM 2522 / FERM P-1141 / JCM 9156 / N-4) TaxID=649639 RepID=E6U0T7_EVAC2|nr:hypothetical protein [Evansella cellulosilytica]ADU29135.1 hypothetical protein Bcell_0858 [Evansella cellulosilytica DSM 2522]